MRIVILLVITVYYAQCFAQDNDAEKGEHSKNKGIQFGLGGALLGIFSVAAAYFYQNSQMRKLNKALNDEKKKSEELLLNILPEKIATELKEKGKVEPVDIYNATVLFTDFKDFTIIAEKLTAKELVDELDVCFKEFDNIISNYQVEKIKIIGDSYMAVAGLTGNSEMAAVNAVKAALLMQTFISQRRKQHSHSFEMRIGLHSGNVISGVVGNKKFQYDIWGDTVNIASRMENAGEQGMVNISEATYNMIKKDHGFTFTERGTLPVKNKGEMKMYFVNHSEHR